MRVVHDVQDEMQCGAASVGELISVSLCNDEEQIHIEGNPKHIVAALKEALEAIEAVLAHPPAPPAESCPACASARTTGYGHTCDLPKQPPQAQASAEHPIEPPASILDALAQAEMADGLYTSHRGCGDDCDDPGHRAPEPVETWPTHCIHGNSVVFGCEQCTEIGLGGKPCVQPIGGTTCGYGPHHAMHDLNSNVPARHEYLPAKE